MATDPLELTQEVIDACDRILEEVNHDGAIEFAEGVRQRAVDMAEGITQRNGYATDKQIDALENMLHGCERWIENIQ